MNLEDIYKKSGALLEGHFKLSSGNHSRFYLQSARVLENPATAQKLALELSKKIKNAGIAVDTVCAPALGGLIAGWELARALNVRFVFTERVDTKMVMRRGFEISKGENVLVCEDIITTGGSALEAAKSVEAQGGNVVAYAALANRGFCQREGSSSAKKAGCKLPENRPLFAIDDFVFEMYKPSECPMCAEGSEAIKPGSRGN